MVRPIIDFHLNHSEKLEKQNILCLLLALTRTQHCRSPPYLLSIKLKKKQSIMLDIFLRNKVHAHNACTHTHTYEGTHTHPL